MFEIFTDGTKASPQKLESPVKIRYADRSQSKFALQANFTASGPDARQPRSADRYIIYKNYR